jgi:hypothetical protein
LEAKRREKLLSKQKISANVVEDESSWTYEGLRDVIFSNNDNLNEVVFEDVIVALDVKGENSGVKDTKNHKNKG